MRIKKPRNFIAANTVTVTVVLCTFRQEPVFLARRIRRRLVPSRSTTSYLRLVSLMSSWVFGTSHLSSLITRRQSTMENDPSPVTAQINCVLARCELKYLPFTDVNGFRSLSPDLLTGLYLKFLRWVREFLTFRRKGKTKRFPESSSLLPQTRLPYYL